MRIFTLYPLYKTAVNALQFYDDTNSILDEDRFLLLGMSNRTNLLLICHCKRMEGEIIRIISARKATKSESKLYGAT